MADIRFENDGKGKYQSFSATVTIKSHVASMSYVSEIEIVGYGLNKAEAVANLDQAMQDVTMAVVKAASECVFPAIQEGTAP